MFLDGGICDNLRALRSSTLSAPAGHPVSALTSRLSATTICGLLVLATLWLVLCRHLSGEWSINEQYSYGWFVPFFAAYLFWLRWESRNANGEMEAADRSAIRASQFLIVAASVLLLVILLPLRAFEIGNPDWRPLGWLHALLVVSFTLLILWRAGGAAWVKHFAFAVAFIFVAVPWVSAIEQPLIQGLMRGVAAIAAETLNLLGIPAQLEGSLIRVNTGLVGVNEACSGVRSLQTSIMIGLLFGELKRFTLARRTLLVVGAVAIALIANCIRALFLVWVAATDQVAAVSRWHDLAGYSIVAAVFIGTMAIAALLGRAGIAHREVTAGDEPAIRASQSAILPRLAFSRASSIVMLLLLVAVELAAHGWYRWHERDLIAVAPWGVRFPEAAPGFHKMEIDEQVRTTLRFDVGAEATWLLAGSAAPERVPSNTPAPRVFGFFFRWNTGGSSVLRARAHRPDICLPNAGWEQIADRDGVEYSTAAGVTIPVREVKFRQPRGNVIAHTFFSLQEDQRRPSEARPDLQLAAGTQPDWSVAGRIRVVRNGIRNLGQQVLEVVIVGNEQLTDAEADRAFQELLQHAIVPAQHQVD